MMGECTLECTLECILECTLESGSGSGYILCCTLLEYYAEAWEVSKKGCYKDRN